MAELHHLTIEILHNLFQDYIQALNSSLHLCLPINLIPITLRILHSFRSFLPCLLPHLFQLFRFLPLKGFLSLNLTLTLPQIKFIFWILIRLYVLLNLNCFIRFNLLFFGLGITPTLFCCGKDVLHSLEHKASHFFLLRICRIAQFFINSNFQI